MRVLVVSEDAKERRRAVSALALHSGAEVVESPDAEDARSRLIGDAEVFDVLVVDGDMRPRGGFAVLYDLRARAELARVQPPPSLVMTSREQDRWLAKWAGANAVMRKPVDPFELVRRVVAIEGEPLAAYGDAASTRQQVAAATRTHS